MAMNRVRVSDYISHKLSEYGVKRVYGIMGGGGANCITTLEDYHRFVDFGVERPGQDLRYALNDEKIRSLGWLPNCNFNEEIVKIVEYYKGNFIW